MNVASSSRSFEPDFIEFMSRKAQLCLCLVMNDKISDSCSAYEMLLLYAFGG